MLREKAWNYRDDVCMVGADALLMATSDSIYLEAMETAAQYLIGPNGTIRNWKESEYNLDKISYGKSLLILHKRFGEERYLQAAKKVHAKLAGYPRVSAGNFWHKDIYPHQVWLDGFYMALPFYCQCEMLLGTHQYDDIINQFSMARKHMLVPQKGLYVHAWDESRTMEWADPQTGRSPCFWLRAMGWYLMALADCYEVIHRQGVDATPLKELLNEALDGLWPYRDRESGIFLQLADRADLADNYPESSGSAMVAYSLMKGARLGMLDPGKSTLGRDVLDCVARACLQETGGQLHLHGVCGSAGLGPGPSNRTDRDGSAEYYLSEEKIIDDQHGAAPCMMAYSEAIWAGNGTKPVLQ